MNFNPENLESFNLDTNTIVILIASLITTKQKCLFFLLIQIGVAGSSTHQSLLEFLIKILIINIRNQYIHF